MMEKKVNSRLLNQSISSQTAKGTVSESRKSQDVSGKQWPRNGRRREPTNFTNTKFDAAIRSNKASGYKTRSNFDKRFSDRISGGGQQRNTSTSSPSITYDDDIEQHQQSSAQLSSSSGLDIDDDFEIDYDESMFLTKNKKQNLNSLLRFKCAPRNSGKENGYNQGSCNGGKKKRFIYKKELCLQSKCKFVVKSNGDYKLHNSLPDQSIEWDLIEQIYVESYEELQCPICLYYPIAAKMTRCGHIFCWPCILHYLDLSEHKTYRKCPICHEAIHQPHLKSTVSRLRVNYKTDDMITFQLMWREKGSVHVSRSADSLHNSFPHLFDNPDQNNKLILANTNEILSIIAREREELHSQLISTDDHMQCDDEEIKYIQKSLNLLDVHENEIKKSIILDKCSSDGGVETVGISEINSNELLLPDDQLEDKFNKIKLTETVSEIATEHLIANNNINDDHDNANNNNPDLKDDKVMLPPPITQTPLKVSRSKTISSSSSVSIDSSESIGSQQITEKNIFNNIENVKTNLVYFYQSSDFQHIYLHRINIRMLEMMYGSMDKAPAQISCKILQKDNESMTDQLRKRYKDLQHLPITCEFDLVEIDLTSIVSDEVLQQFKDELVTRHNKRQRKAHEERKREKRINRVNDQLIGHFQSEPINIDITSIHDFPSCGASVESQPDELMQQLDNSNSGWQQQEPSTSTGTIPKRKPSKNQVSFATMLTTQPKVKENLWPSLARPSNKSSPLLLFDGNVTTTTNSNNSSVKLSSNQIDKKLPQGSIGQQVYETDNIIEKNNVPIALNSSIDSASITTSPRSVPSNFLSSIDTTSATTTNTITTNNNNNKKKKNKTTLYLTGERFNGI